MWLDLLMMVAQLEAQGSRAKLSVISDALDMSPQSAWNHLDLLIGRKLVRKVRTGEYALDIENPFFQDVISIGMGYNKEK